MEIRDKIIEKISFNVSDIKVRPVKVKEKPHWQELMNTYHYLGFKTTVGEQIWYVATTSDDLWVSLIGWSSAAYKNHYRDRLIGWDEAVKNKRLKYIANNFRFLIVPWAQTKNLGSKILSLNVSRLSHDWMTFYGHVLYMVETFVDTKRFRGTVYKASGWRALGETKGYRRCNGRYYFHGNSKTIFIRALSKDAVKKLSSLVFNLKDRRSFMVIDWKKLPLEGNNGLFSLLEKIPDHRYKRGVRHSFISILAVATCGMLSGALTFEAIAEWGYKLTIKELRKLGSWRDKAPSIITYKRVLGGIDPDEFDTIIYGWLKNINTLDNKLIAIDGKTLKGSHDGEKKAVHLLSAVVHEAKIVIAQKDVGEKTNEIPVARQMLEAMNVEGAVITADAMHAQKETAKTIVEKNKADFFLP